MSPEGTSKRQIHHVHTLRNAADTGDYRRMLVALRNQIADQLDSGKVMPRDYAALSKRFADLCKEINELDRGNVEESAVGKALDVDDEVIGDDA